MWKDKEYEYISSVWNKPKDRDKELAILGLRHVSRK